MDCLGKSLKILKMELPSYLLLKQNELMYCLEPVYSTPQMNIPVMTISRPEGIVRVNEPPPADTTFDTTTSLKGLLGVINLHAGIPIWLL